MYKTVYNIAWSNQNYRYVGDVSETFSHWKPLCGIHVSQEFEVHLHAEGVESQAKEMVGAHQGL